jgi:putative chitinase
MEIGDITTINRAACFLGQLAHESGDLRYWVELADGKAYEGRADLGNTEPGDGPRYRGRGPIQLTGRANHRAFQVARGWPVITHPEMLQIPAVGMEAAEWYWTSRGLNAKADEYDIRAITRAINGGLTALDMRVSATERARWALSKQARLVL